jgi:hypothetical protein
MIVQNDPANRLPAPKIKRSLIAEEPGRVNHQPRSKNMNSGKFLASNTPES